MWPNIFSRWIIKSLGGTKEVRRVNIFMSCLNSWCHHTARLIHNSLIQCPSIFLPCYHQWATLFFGCLPSWSQNGPAASGITVPVHSMKRQRRVVTLQQVSSVTEDFPCCLPVDFPPFRPVPKSILACKNKSLKSSSPKIIFLNLEWQNRERKNWEGAGVVG